MQYVLHAPISGQTRAACVYDARFLYAAFDVDNSAGSKPEGTPEWAGEAVTLQLRSPQEAVDVEFIVYRDGHPRVDVRLQRKSKTRFESSPDLERLSVSAATRERANGYTAELRAPLCLLAGADCAEDGWWINFTRGVQPQVREDPNVWAPPPGPPPPAGRLEGFIPDWTPFIEAAQKVSDGDGLRTKDRVEDALGPLWIAWSGEAALPPRRFEWTLRQPAYRRSIFASQPEKRVEIGWEFHGSTQEGSVEATLFDRSGAALKSASAAIGVGSALLDVSDLPAGDYSLVVSPKGIPGTGPADLPELAARTVDIHVLKPAAREVYLDADGILMVDGEPTFVLGSYWFSETTLTEFVNPANERLGLPPVTVAEMMRDLKSRGFVGGPTSPGPPPTDAFMAEVKSAGMQALAQMEQLFHGHHDRIDALKSCGGLLAWYGWDEMTGPVLAAGRDVYEAMCRIDPYHPVGCAVMPGTDIDVFAQAVDILMPDVYPLHPGWEMHYREGAILSDICDYMGSAAGRLPPGKALWGVVQAFGIVNYYRQPETAEYRNMCYQYLASGARGLLAYSYASSEPYGNRHFYLPATPLWGTIGEVNRELNRLASFWTAPGGRRWMIRDRRVVVLERATDQGAVRLMVNRSYDPVDVTIEIPAGTATVRDLLSGKALPVSDDPCTDTIDSLDVRAYHLGF